MNTRAYLDRPGAVEPLTAVDDLTALVARATLAPSTHNVQPWRWVVRGPDCLELELDEDAAQLLPFSDPGGRELVMSCGATLLTLRVAAAEALLRARVDLDPAPGTDRHPNQDRSSLLARVRLEPAAVDAEFAALDDAVPRRRTAWHRFTDRPLPEGLAERLAAEAAVEGAHLKVLDPATRARVGGLVRIAEVEKVRDPHGLREILHLPSPRAAVTDATRLWRVSSSLRLLRAAPVVAVLWTQDEGREAWLRAGQALQRILLVATRHDVLAGFVNAPCQVPAVRAELARVTAAVEGVAQPDGEELPVHPQALLRLGFPLHRPPRTPRHPVRDVLVVDTVPRRAEPRRGDGSSSATGGVVEAGEDVVEQVPSRDASALDEPLPAERDPVQRPGQA